jgi:cob(I)alamin adenosyltransferase
LTEKNSQGLVQVFTGNGKGKTTAALGTVMRAAGHGLRICLIFFMKGSHDYGEYHTLSRLPNVDYASFGLREFSDPEHPKPEAIEQAEKALAAARQAITGGRYDLVVLDEVNVAVSFKLLAVEDVLKLIQDKPANVELILTGRYADARLIEAADLVTEMVKVKHPFDRGVKARRGIEY